jgi:hypothetical protein
MFNKKKGVEKMKKMVGFLCSVAMLTASQLIVAAAGGDITNNTMVQGCAGQGVTCNFANNAVGDLKEIYINSTTPTYNLGAINKPRTIQITVPLANSQKLFSFSITKAYSSNALDKDMVGIPMEVMLASSAPDNQALIASPYSRSMIKIYRRMKGEQLWTEAYTVLGEADINQLLPVTVVISPNGDTELELEGRTTPVILPLGKAALG